MEAKYEEIRVVSRLLLLYMKNSGERLSRQPREQVHPTRPVKTFPHPASVPSSNRAAVRPARAWGLTLGVLNVHRIIGAPVLERVISIPFRHIYFFYNTKWSPVPIMEVLMERLWESTRCEHARWSWSRTQGEGYVRNAPLFHVATRCSSTTSNPLTGEEHSGKLRLLKLISKKLQQIS